MTLIADRYRLGAPIGTGGMSNVYGADDALLGRDVAVKMLKLDMARDDNFRERFRREAQNSAKLNHPNIVSVFDTGEADVEGVSVPYIVMERIYGRTLRDIVREDGPLTPEQAAEFMIPVSHALQASHDAGIIHRDIKPANIMVTNTGSVKVMDFGIARALDDSTSAMTQTSAVIGTAQYLSPEQARGKQADARSDIYAAGCVLYEAVTGTAPFEGETPFAVAYQHVQEDPQPPSERITTHDLSPTEAVNIDAVVLTAMAKHPADRYQTATELADDLTLLQRGSVTSAARAHVQPARQESVPTTATRVVAADATHAAPAPAPAPAPVPQSIGAHAAAPAKGNNRLAKWLAGILALLVLAGIILFATQVLRDTSGTTGAPTDEASAAPEASDMVSVPDLAGQHRDSAASQLEQLGLVVEQDETPNPDVPADHVISSNPTAGSQLRAGTTVRLSISTGEELTKVPDVTGATPSAATDTLTRAGLRLNPQVQQTSSDTVPEGSIVSQSPAAQSEAARGTAVTITVSTGPDQVRVPSLTGMSWEEARDTLSSLGFTPTPDYVDSLEPDGQVLAVGGSGTEADRGTEVVVRVSNGMLFTMPDITRMDPAEANSALHSAGWTGSQVRVAPERPGTGALIDNGLIAATDPSPGATLRKDAEVTVFLWEFSLRNLAP
ncbi:Stk1 family PASTA domain-containing Ser/Thr kinase [Corynebacterium doosanense]|uniref:non-specific serine/threonine protein kinase n=1 Tax=Corynebacterium doosanense CAU 212 = DSM 45436 TaxID=558173 RepID=A0A097ICQ6_9CORY|nr:Stk1 family PASTA domain-containing Ser/Thr kinase [Corynebacterium doosanense]AIT59920.1 serine/threonine protein kinase [Corynebacterium doosanense CAU 212 = DSM 45436]